MPPRLTPLAVVLALTTVGGALAGSVRAADPHEGMVLVPPGAFTMGAADGNPDEKPVRQVTLPAFYIDRTEVTQEEYARFVQATGHPAPPDWPGSAPDPKKLKHPVVNVTWFDANAYARWAGKRLPTEAEWEKAARGSDGRPLPWGSHWDDKKANVGDKDVEPVGRHPEGASPCGALDLLGNAWEWTSDWYQPYPGSEAPSVHYGEKYRVVRGSGGIDFYPPLNGKRASIRGRIQPFGRYDSVGFRCVRDAEEPRRVAPDLKPPREREKPVPPKVETPAEVAARYRTGVPVEVRDTTGTARTGVATFGLPFPEGVVKDVSTLRAAVPLQARTLAKWRDGSVRWALVDAPASVSAGGAQELKVRWDGGPAAPKPEKSLVLYDEPDQVVIQTGAARIRIKKGDTRWLSLESNGQFLDGPDQHVNVSEGKLVDEKPVSAGATRILMMRPPHLVKIEDRGPLRARVRVEGWMVDPVIEQQVIRYTCRIDARAGSKSVGLVHTFSQMGPSRLLMVHDYQLRFRTNDLPAAEERVELGAAGKVLKGGPASHLEQTSSTAFTFKAAPESAPAPGTRADGWISFGKGSGNLVALKHFWEQFPKALARDRAGVTVSLWNGPEPFDADQGLSKSHELLLSVDSPGPARQAALAQLQEPLFGIAPADWYCATRGLGMLAPYDLSRYPQYETEVEAAADLMARSRPHGMRHFGDNYFGGPYKGINSFQDLEYDVHYNHFMQFARTGARKYLDTGILQSRHNGDIDIKHDGGPQWKHSPRHTTTEAELGHVFLRGLVAYTWLTGDPEGLENAKVIGNWLIKVVANPRSQGNERQIGWSLYALTGIYEATWDRRYLDAMKANVDHLLAGQDKLGRFSIRYDNRISFFYGITLSGFVKYYEVTGDERIAESIERIVNRIHGFYPEYAGRTLEGLAWLYMRTGDPEVRMTGQRTWESTMTWRPFDIGGMTIFTTRFLPAIETLGLACPKEWDIPATGPVEDGMRRHHYRAGSGVLYLESVNRTKPVELVLLRHVGTSPASVRVSDASGKETSAQQLPATGEPLQYAKLRLPAGGPYRVEIRSDDTRAWDLITSEATRRVFHAPDWKNLEALTPRLYFQVPKGAREVNLTLEAEGEGFKGAVLYDGDGNVAGALAKFVDFEDTKRYTYPFKVAVPAGQDGRLWSLDLQAVSISKAEGITPYVSTHPDAFFLPGRPAAKPQGNSRPRGTSRG